MRVYFKSVKALFLMLLPVAVLAVIFSPALPEADASTGNGFVAPEYRRVISLSPSSTETLFALGLGRLVVGVTRYCAYPPEACTLAKVGGYLDPGYEAILSLDPDIVVLLPEQERVKKNLVALGIKTVTVSNRSVGDILTSVKKLGELFGVKERARELTRALKERVDTVRRRTAGLPKPRVLISVSRDMGILGIKSVYVAGTKTYFDELIGIAGGVNAYTGTRIKYPKVSREGLVAINPDVIIDLVPALRKKGWNREAILGEWKALKGVKAVENGGVSVLGNSYVSIPGTRFILLLEDIADAVHPGTVRTGKLR